MWQDFHTRCKIRHFIGVEQNFRPMRCHSWWSYTRLQLVWTLCKAEKKILWWRYDCMCLCESGQDRLWKTDRGSGIEYPCLITWKPCLIVAGILMVDMSETVRSEQHGNVHFCFFRRLSIQPHNGEPHSFYHQYHDCSGRSGGISLVLLFRAILNLKGWGKPILLSFRCNKMHNTLHGLLTASSKVKKCGNIFIVLFIWS